MLSSRASRSPLGMMSRTSPVRGPRGALARGTATALAYGRVVECGKMPRHRSLRRPFHIAIAFDDFDAKSRQRRATTV